jgi:hypothetical protein
MLTHFLNLSGQKVLMCHDKISIINEGEINYGK